MKILLALVMCLCSVRSFRIFPVAVQPAMMPRVEISTAGVNEDAFYTNNPTSVNPEELVVTISGSASSTLSGSTKGPDANQNEPKLDLTATGSTSLLESATVSSSIVAVLETETKSLSESSTVLENKDTASTTTSYSDSATQLKAGNSSTNLSEPNSALESASAEFSRVQPEPAADSASLLKSESSSTKLSHATTLTESAKISTNPSGVTSTTESAKASSLPDSAVNSSSISETEKASTIISDSSSLSESAKTSTSLSDSAVNSSNLSVTEKASTSLLDTSNQSESAKVSTIPLLSSSSSTTSQEEVTVASIPTDSATDQDNLLEVTTEDLSFLSLELLPPKTEYRKNEPDPRYDY